MLNTLVKPNDNIECEPRNILVSHHSQGNVLKITIKLQAYMITCFFCKTVVCPEGFSILANSSCNFKLEIQESILMKLSKPTLNKNISLVPLHLFWYRVCKYTLLREHKESNLIIFWFISLITSIEMLCKCISLPCVEVYSTLQM